MAGIPDHIKALAELSPVEDLMLAVLRDGLPEMQVKSLISADQTFPLVIVRRGPSFGEWGGDTRFTDSAQVSVQCFAADPNGDEDAAILSEACRVVLRDAWLDNKVVPGRGHFTRVELQSAPRRVTDWATASGPVQYADLPTGVWRYESIYQIEIRKPRNRPYPNPTP
ncbi:tail terminator [Streptomyces phage VieEnRose]|nr:tail terminator [Streptomyces phage VieEnRose]